ncbi:MAG: ComEC/Rec2 family competence protein [Intestinimonas sp.]
MRTMRPSSGPGWPHAVAVSGPHIGFLAQLAVALAGSRYRRRAALLAVPLMVVYALAVGCTPSVLRAVVMHTLLLLGAILGRETDPPTSLSFALMLLLLQNPYAARSVSLQPPCLCGGDRRLQRSGP